MNVTEGSTNHLPRFAALFTNAFFGLFTRRIKKTFHLVCQVMTRFEFLGILYYFQLDILISLAYFFKKKKKVYLLLILGKVGGAVQYDSGLKKKTYLPKILHRDKSRAAAVTCQEAASDGGPGEADRSIDPQHDLHPISAQNAHLTWARLSSSPSDQRAHGPNQKDTNNKKENKTR